MSNGSNKFFPKFEGEIKGFNSNITTEHFENSVEHCESIRYETRKLKEKRYDAVCQDELDILECEISDLEKELIDTLFFNTMILFTMRK